MKLGNRYSQHSFAKVPQVNMARSRFDRSFAVKDTMDFDYLVPILVDEVLPGDTINLSVKSFCRLATQLTPVLDNMYMDYFFFFVPNRLVWDNWEKFMGAQDNPGDSIDYEIPTITTTAVTGEAVGSIYDKMGIPTGIPGLQINALPLRCYALIWNEWFRDQNLQNSVTVNKDDGPDAPTDYTLLKRAKKHDYFTSCLPWPQKGDAVEFPLGGIAPVWGSQSALPTALGDQNNSPIFAVYGDRATTDGAHRASMGYSFDTTSLPVTGGADQHVTHRNMSLGGSGTGVAGNPSDLVFLDKTLSQAFRGTAVAPFQALLEEATGGSSINVLRQAMMLQSLLELDARGGTRYVEILRAHFNVVSPDFRLQRPEFLSGGTVHINQHPVAQTAPTSGTNYLAQLASYSTASNMGNNIGFSKSFVEHGYVIGLVQARADVTYQQGLKKMWSRQTKHDFFWPKLQELGEQAVLKREIYAQGDANDDEVFGYQERYAEYRYSPSEIRGQFRSTYATPLDIWHLAEEFGSEPALNATFIESNTPIERSLAVTSTYPHLLCDYWFDLKHARPMVTYGVPASLGRF